MPAGPMSRMLLMTLVTTPLVTAEAPVPDNFDPDPDVEPITVVGQGSVAVPTILGCVLAGMVVIVWTAYIVVRSRSRARGYQSVSTSPQ